MVVKKRKPSLLNAKTSGRDRSMERSGELLQRGILGMQIET